MRRVLLLFAMRRLFSASFLCFVSLGLTKAVRSRISLYRPSFCPCRFICFRAFSTLLSRTTTGSIKKIKRNIYLLYKIIRQNINRIKMIKIFYFMRLMRLFFPLPFMFRIWSSFILSNFFLNCPCENSLIAHRKASR